MASKQLARKWALSKFLTKSPVMATTRSFHVSRLTRLSEDDHELKNLSELPRPNYDGVDLDAPLINPKDRFKETSEELHKFGRYLITSLPKFIQQFSVWKDELTIYCGPTALVPVATFLKNHTSAQFKAVMDITAADYPTRHNRFEVVYNMLSVRFNSRIRIKTYASEISPVPSLTGLYAGAQWYERETYDMFGVFFEDNQDLRRILTDYGFDGHPLRKDFPTTGYTEVRFDNEKRRVVYEPLELTQAWRNFSVGSSVWEQVGEGDDDAPDSFKLPSPPPEPEADKEKK